MTKKATASIDPVCMELVRAGLITYKQLNEVHRIVQETGGSIDDVLVSKGLVSKEQLAKRRAPMRPKKKTLKVSHSIDLVKSGLVTFKQLNEAHREARSSQGAKTVVDILLEKGYVNDVQLATLPKPSERAKHKKFSSSWDLFRAGVVSLKALNDCHRHIKLESPEKSLKEALVERGFITREQLTEVEKKRGSGPLTPGRAMARSPFMEKYAKELEGIPDDLKQELRKEHLASEGITPEEDEAGPVAAPAAETEEEDFQDQKTFMDLDEEDGAPSAAFQSEKTMLGDDEEDGDGGGAEFQSQKTMMDSSDEEAPAEESADFRAAKTFLGADDDEDFRAQKTMVGGDEEEPDAGTDFRAAQTFMDVGAPAEAAPPKPAGTDSDPNIQGARTFLDMGDAGEKTSSDPDLRGARTFMDMGEEPAAPKKAAEVNAGSTFMDMDLEGGGGGGMFGATETGSGVGPGMLGAAADPRASTFQKSDTALPAEGGTFMDVGQDAGAKSKSGASAASVSKTDIDVKAGKSGASQTSVSKTDVGSSSAGASSAGAKSKSSASSTSASGAGTSTGSSHAGGSSTSAGASTASKGSSTGGGSATEAETDEAKKAKAKKKKDDEDAYKHPLVGKIIGGCRIVKKLGEGGMGAVFLAEHTKLKRQSVIKVVPAHLSQNRQLIARFEREARAAAIVQHPNIVAVYNVGEENGVHYIEMEFVDGSAIDAVLKEKKAIEQMECVRIIKDACRGLAEAHKNGIIHRDIKPDNIMMTRKGVVKIADFGLARAGSEEMELTKVGQILGTPAYMSPEQCQGKPTDHRADIYSLGATFYAMITGKRPFTGSSVMEIMQKHIDEEPISPREYNPEIAVQVVKIILRMMAKKPEDRFQSSEEVIQAIDQFMKEEGTEHLQEVQKLLGNEWRLVKKLGQGGMGAVYSARCLVAKPRVKENELVAIKVLNREVNQDEVKRFEQEAKLALEIDHENIIRVLEYKISETINYIVMEFVEGKSVRDIIRDKKKLDAKEAARVVREAGKGLGRAHELGIIHRDIKPDNLMIAKSGAVKVADFGIAKHVEGQSELTQAGVVVGTPHYMSPEQCVGASRGIQITQQADIYSLGATLYFMVTGQKPFEGDTQMTIILQHLNQPPKPPREVDPAIDESLSNIILNMMAKKPRYRYKSVDEVVKDLDAAERGKKVYKHKKIDVSFEETGRSKVLLAGAAAAMVAFLGVAIIISRGDPVGRAQKEIAAALKRNQDSIEESRKAKNFADALGRFKAARDEVTAADTVNADHSLAKGALSNLDVLETSVKSDMARRDADAADIGGRLDAGIKVAEDEAKALLARTTIEDDEPAAAGRFVSASGKAYATSQEATAERLGDAPLVDRARVKGREVVTRLNDVGHKRLDANVAYVTSNWANKSYRFYQAASKHLSDWKRPWDELKIDGKPLEVADATKKAIGDIDELEKAECSNQNLQEAERLCYAAFSEEKNMLARHEQPNSWHILTALKAQQANIQKLSGVAGTFHYKLLDDEIARCTQAREPQAKDIVTAAVAKAADLSASGKTIGKPHSALAALEAAKESVQELYDRNDPKDRATVQDHFAKLDQAEKGVIPAAAQRWSELKDKLDETAWGARRFLEAEDVYKSVVDDSEAQEKIPSADGKTFVALKELAKDELSAMTYNLELLRPYDPLDKHGTMVAVAAGPFVVGLPREEGKRETNRTSNGLPQNVGAFYIDRTVVTVGQYQQFLLTDKKTGRSVEATADQLKHARDLYFLCHKHLPDPRFCDPDEPQTENGHMPDGIFELDASKPMAFVSYFDAKAFARWAGKRLPREVEWEKAASWDPVLGHKNRYPWGDTWDPSRVVCAPGPGDEVEELPAANSKETGESPCHALGMAGGVWEWTEDDYNAYPGGNASIDPDFGHGFKVIRGGSYQDYKASAFRTTYRDRRLPGERKPNVGFRCVRDE